MSRSSPLKIQSSDWPCDEFLHCGPPFGVIFRMTFRDPAKVLRRSNSASFVEFPAS
jgi:hypothetical protein